jgi:hypothetical protein
MASFGLAAVSEAKIAERGHLYFLNDSWTYEGTGTTTEDHLNTQLTLARTGTGVYTLTFPTDKKPSAMRWAYASCSTAATFGVCTYNASTGVVTVTIYLHDGNAQNTDEELINFLGLFVK